MKRTPYTVPEGFFERAESNALKAASKISSRRRIAAGSVLTCAALALILTLRVPERTISPATVSQSLEYSDEEILETYDYDIFLTNLF